jgi:hypothetical protein
LLFLNNNFVAKIPHFLLQKQVDSWLYLWYNTNTMKRTTIIVKLPRLKRRAVELYDSNSPFKGKVEENRKAYKRKPKNQKEVDKDLGL